MILKQTACISKCGLEVLTAGIICICTAQYESVASPQRLCSPWCIFVALNTSLKKHDM